MKKYSDKPVSYTNLNQSNDILTLREMASAIEYGKITLDSRVQIKLPKLVLQKLDTLFPKLDRSTSIAKLVIDAVLAQERFTDPLDAAYFSMSEQEDLDDLWNYLEEREKKK